MVSISTNKRQVLGDTSLNSPTRTTFSEKNNLMKPKITTASTTQFQEEGATNIEVVVRVRPLLEREIQINATCLVEEPSNSDFQTVALIPKANSPQARKYREPPTFQFDRCYWSFDPTSVYHSNQYDVFKNTGESMVNNTLSGFNSCILAYGQTGSGKTYSMMGTDSEPGLIPYVCEDLFNKLNQLVDTKFELKLTFFEIYQETVYDLLNDSNGKNHLKLRIREGADKIPFVENLSEFVVNSIDDVKQWIKKGVKNRTTAATNLNKHSSRSHSILTLNLIQEKFNTVENSIVKLTSNLRLVDLAGSEKSIANDGLDIQRQKEGSKINKSLTTLGRILTMLSESASSNSTKVPLVPYRESTLTWLLKDNIGGNSKTTMVACISPVDFDESLSTLRFATITSKIRNHAKLNEESQTDLNNLVKKYEAERHELLAYIENLETSLPSKRETEDSDHEKKSLEDELSQKKEFIRKLNNYVAWQNKYIETTVFSSRVKESKLQSTCESLRATQDKLVSTVILAQQNDNVTGKILIDVKNQLLQNPSTIISKIDELILQVEKLDVLSQLDKLQDDLQEVEKVYEVYMSDNESDLGDCWDI